MTAALRVPLPATAAERKLRARIGGICRSLRIAALAYPVWELALIVWHWSDRDGLTGYYSALLKVPIADIALWQRGTAVAFHLAAWLLVARACLEVYRLFGGFLIGEVFCPEAAARLRRTALFGLAAVVAGILIRPVLTVLVTLGNPPDQRAIGLLFAPQDLLNVLFLVGFLALAEVFRAAAEIAAENAEFV
ncbi:DUF2975 domain-containing protein [Prosthecodimorpha staleyi]|uniref:DUF2975 domain-containing protein n=1 Tax=Prosthecodimorpha staleyi TaxID=2840188 RepID=A0A947GDS6_9HYPH|nr:DUF2975 domain-containing protein [Prosthecodimorpha staleyi]MBT9290616.1 hypothetical protein [Prosthecodimorpha staleyi]